MLDNLRKDLRGAIDKIVKSNSVDKETIIQLKRDIQRSLIMSDVEAGLVVSLTKRLQQRALDETPPPGLSRKKHIIKILRYKVSTYSHVTYITNDALRSEHGLWHIV